MEVEPNILRLSQILQHPHFPEEAVEHELKAVRREMSTRLDSPHEAHSHAARLAMSGKPYGRSVGGYHDKIDFDVDTLKNLHAKYYKLGRMSLVVTGAAKLEDVVRLAEQYFVADADPIFVDEDVPAATPGKDLRTGLVRENSQNVRLSIGYPMTPEFRQRFNDNRLAFNMATSAIRNAAFMALRYDKGISYDGSVGISSENHPNAWSVDGDVTTDAGKVEVALDTFAKVLDQGGSTYGDVDLAGTIATYKYAFNCSINSTDDRAGSILERLESLREPEDMHAIVRRLNKIKVAQVRAAIDEIVGFVGSHDRYVQITGKESAIGEVDRIIDQSEIM